MATFRPEIDTPSQALELCKRAQWAPSTTHPRSMAMKINDELADAIRSTVKGAEDFDPSNPLHCQKLGNAIGAALNKKYDAGQLSTAELKPGTLLRVTSALKTLIDKDVHDLGPRSH